MFPASENPLSHGTEVAALARYFLARVESCGCAPACADHHCSGQSVSLIVCSALQRLKALDPPSAESESESEEKSKVSRINKAKSRYYRLAAVLLFVLLLSVIMVLWVRHNNLPIQTNNDNMKNEMGQLQKEKETLQKKLSELVFAESLLHKERYTPEPIFPLWVLRGHLLEHCICRKTSATAAPY
ncbi:hypothetical protein SRHO_G00250020 [Serrasalmus rhombeus]